MTTPNNKSEVSSPATITIPLGEYHDMDAELQRQIQWKLEACKKVEELQSQLTDIREQVELANWDLSCHTNAGGGMDALLKWVKAIEKDLSQSRAQVETLKIERDEARVARDFAELACEKAHADGAVMRGGIELVRSMLKVYISEPGRLQRGSGRR